MAWKRSRVRIPSGPPTFRMMVMSAPRLVEFLVVFAGLALQSLAACTCVSEAGGSVLDEADLVFRGKIESVRYLDPIALVPVSPGDRRKVNRPRRFVVRLRVGSAWKGSPGRTISLYHRESNGSGGDCYGFWTEIGLDLLVFASYETVVSRESEVGRYLPDWSDQVPVGRKILAPSLCAPNGKIEDSGLLLQRLGAPRTQTQPSDLKGS